MIEKIRLKFGSSPGRPPLEFIPTAVTVVIGPNNAGKSKLISEIAMQCSSGQSMSSDVILESLVFSIMSEAAADLEITKLTAKPPPNSVIHPDLVYMQQGDMYQQVPLQSLRQGLLNPNNQHFRSQYAQYYFSKKMINLNGRSRIGLVDDQPSGDFQNPPNSTFQHLLKDDVFRKGFRASVYKSFGS